MEKTFETIGNTKFTQSSDCVYMENKDLTPIMFKSKNSLAEVSTFFNTTNELLATEQFQSPLMFRDEIDVMIRRNSLSVLFKSRVLEAINSIVVIISSTRCANTTITDSIISDTEKEMNYIFDIEWWFNVAPINILDTSIALASIIYRHLNVYNMYGIKDKDAAETFRLMVIESIGEKISSMTLYHMSQLHYEAHKYYYNAGNPNCDTAVTELSKKKPNITDEDYVGLNKVFNTFPHTGPCLDDITDIVDLRNSLTTLRNNNREEYYEDDL